jgi:hypothetical protein
MRVLFFLSVWVSLFLAGCSRPGKHQFALEPLDDAALPIDVDGDGRADLLQPGKDDILLYRNSGGGFESKGEVLTPDSHSPLGEMAMGIALFSTDLNGDGEADVFLCRSLRTQVWMGRDGLVDAFHSPGGSLLADFNRDKLPDLVRMGDSDKSRARPIEILVGKDPKSLEFAEPKVVDRVKDVHILSAIDVTGNGRIDVVTSSTNGLLTLYTQEDGEFRKQEPMKLEGDLIGWAHLNDSANASMFRWVKGGGLTIWDYGSEGEFELKHTLDVRTRPNSVSLGHLDEDQHLDLVVLPSPPGVGDLKPSTAETRPFLIFKGEAGGFSTPQSREVRRSASTVRFADIDGDSKLDFYFTGYEPLLVVHRR